MKNNIKIVIAVIIAAIVFTGVGIYAESKIAANEVNYKENETVKDALDDLYNKTDNLDMTVKKFCKLSEGTHLSIGAKYSCDPGDGVARDFYLLAKNNEEVKLIMYKI